MTISEAQRKRVSRYVKENYDQIMLRVPKETGALIRNASAESKKSLNAFIVDIVLEYIENNQTDNET